MARTPKTLVSEEQVDSTAETVYTVPANTKTIIRKFNATNTTINAPTLTVYFVPTGGAVGDDTTVIKDLAFGSKETKNIEIEGQVLEAATTIQVISSTANEITLYVSGIEVVV